MVSADAGVADACGAAVDVAEVVAAAMAVATLVVVVPLAAPLPIWLVLLLWLLLVLLLVLLLPLLMLLLHIRRGALYPASLDVAILKIRGLASQSPCGVATFRLLLPRRQR